MNSAWLVKCFVQIKTATKMRSISLWLSCLLSFCGCHSGGLEAGWGQWAEHGLAVPGAGVQVCVSAGM